MIISKKLNRVITVFAMGLLIFISGLSISAVSAYDLLYNTSISYFSGLYNPSTDASINGISMDSDILHEGRIKYHAMNNFAVELSTGSWSHKENYSVNHRVGNIRFPGKGECKVTPSMISFYYYFPETAMKNLMPYAGAGAGWYNFDFKYTADTIVLPGDTSFLKEDATTGYHIFGGLEYFPKKDFSFKGEIRYTRADVSADVDNTSVTPDAFIDLTGYTVFIGLNYYFREAKE